jgi:DNA-directed RNA polymerase specialized sigma24 family protein
MDNEQQRIRLTELFERYADRVYAYAARHVELAAAQDIASETFLLAWRRIDDVPDDALPWLLVVARNTIANSRRAHARRPAQISLDAAISLAGSAGADEIVLERQHLLLSAWDGLTSKQAAHVLGCSVRAFDVRLHRARNRLHHEIDDGNTPQHSRPMLAQEAT